jgi:hypothetical protein
MFKYNVLLLAALVMISLMTCISPKLTRNPIVSSPSGTLEVTFQLEGKGTPVYTVSYMGKPIIYPSSMGFEFRNAPMDSGFRLIRSVEKSFNETWELPWGEQRNVLNRYNELIVELEERKPPSRKLNLLFRAYDDGIAFRYEFPEQVNTDEVIITDEKTQFRLTGDHTCWWIPGDWDSYEHLYSTTSFSEIDATAKRNHPGLTRSFIPENAVNTPITMKTADGLYLSFHEADLTDYAGMTLKVDPEKLVMETSLVRSDRLGYKVRRRLPFKTPWRMIQISKNAAGLIESNLILNLNEPNRLGDVSWIKPMKYIGIWWAMHLGKSSWDMASGKHGATTENAKKTIDFAAANHIRGVLIEGWNTGWEHWIGFEDREGVFDFVTPYPDYDLEAVARYAQEKGVQIIMHHETSAAPRTYEQQLDTAYTLMRKLGMQAVKTGYVGKIIPDGEYHHGQWMVNHYRHVIETAAKYKIAVDVHEPIAATGLRRSYPNAISREGLRGQEFNAWSPDGGNPPEHLSIVAFTRMLAGPIDFTPGVFNIKLNPYKENNQVNTTLAQQLALYVIVYSPVQMACDLIENYENQPAFQFIRDVGVDWEQTRVLNGEIGDYVTIARQERASDRWFVGSITDENARSVTIDFDFLDKGKTYRATIYRDGENAHWDMNPTSLDIENTVIDKRSTRTFNLAPGGGLAISLIPEDG